jgi:hypothetical protein
MKMKGKEEGRYREIYIKSKYYFLNVKVGSLGRRKRLK